MDEQYLLVVDSRPGLHAPTSRMIKKSEYREVYPDKNHAQTICHIFKYKKPEKMPVPEALFLIKKYEQLSLVDNKHQPITVKDALKILDDGTDRSDDLTDMNYFDIVAVADTFGLRHGTFSMKGVNLKKEIRRLRSTGVKPKIEPDSDPDKENENEVN